MKSHSLTTPERDVLDGLNRSLTMFRLTLGLNVTAAEIQTVLEVALEEGVTATECQRRINGRAGALPRVLHRLASPAKRGNIRELLVLTENDAGDAVMVLSSRGRLTRQLIFDRFNL